jgi:hypothetical protein
MRANEGETMRKIWGLAAALMLGACGNGNSEDFTVDVAMSPDRVKAELAQLDGGIGLQALSLPAIVTDTSEADQLSFQIGGEKGSDLLMRFEEVGTNGTRIHVALSVPVTVAKIQGEAMFISEGKAEDMLKDRLQSWAERANSGEATLASLNEAMLGLSLTASPGKLDDILGASGDPHKLAALLGPGLMAEMEAQGSSEAFAAADLDRPMLDPDAETWEASAPMDEADGSGADDPGEGTSADWGGGDF